MENNNGKGIFYGVIGVATLIVAIIGATFAYFTATTTADTYVQGTAATAGLTVDVIRMTGWSASEGTGLTADTAKFTMVPQLDQTLNYAILGHDPDGATGPQTATPCIDAGGSLVCSIYRIVVENTGSAAITVNGYIDFYSSSTTTDGSMSTEVDQETGLPKEGGDLMNHIKWARLTQPASVVDENYHYDDVKKDAEGDLDIAMPTTLLSYTKAATAYQTTPDGQSFYYLGGGDADGSANQYLYGMEVTGEKTGTVVNKDILGAGYIVSGGHGVVTDLIDPTDDLTYTFVDTPSKTATAVANNTKDDATADGKWYLAANGNDGDTKVFYIVVWISENKAEQNDVDFGQFTGTVTFKSMEGSGATSTFTENYSAS